MNNYRWFYIFTLTDFEALGLVSRTYELTLTGVGKKEILVTKGNYVGITVDGVFLPISLHDKNPFEFEDMAIYIDTDDQVWLGYLVEDV